MNIDSAHAVYNSGFQPMYATDDSGTTGLVRLCRIGEGGELLQVPEGADDWAREAHSELIGLTDDNLDEVRQFEGVEPDQPWYATFLVEDPFDGVLEIWAGRFIPDTRNPIFTEEVGVFVFLQQQRLEVDAHDRNPVLKPIKADRSIVYPTEASMEAAASAREQGCNFYEAEGRFAKDWPTHD